MGAQSNPLILCGVEVPADLADVIRTHRSLFGGFRMELEDGQPRDYLDQLMAEYDTHTAAIDQVVETVTRENRQMSETEDAECQRHQQAAEALQPQIERWKNLRQTRQAVVVQREALPPAMGPQVQVIERAGGHNASDGDDDVAGLRRIHRTPGAFAADLIRASKGDPASRERIQRALQKVMTTDTPGLLPVPFVGDIIGRITAVRPVVESATKVALPASGMQWKRPKITAHTKVDKQTTEKTEVASQKFTVGSVDVGLVTLAGAVNMSIQEIERTDPSALDLVFGDLAAQYGRRSEQEAVAQLTAGTATSAQVDLAAAATADDFRAALYSGAGLIYGATNGTMPNVIYASLDQWARVGGWARAINPQDRDASGQPNSLALSFAGMPVVVAPDLPEGSLLVGNTAFFEVSEQPGAPVQLRALEVGILGWEVGVYGLFAAQVTEAGAFVKLAPPVTP